MRGTDLYSIKRALPRMSWSPKNLYNLMKRDEPPLGPDDYSRKISFRTSSMKLYGQRWKAKALLRGYHGDYIPEKIFKRWYLPETLPDVKPERAVRPPGTDETLLQNYARRKVRESTWKQQEKEMGLAPIGSLMFQEVERRIDVFIFRCCFVADVYEARRLVIHGHVLLNGKKHNSANTRLAPGDMVTVDPKFLRILKRPPAKDIPKVDDIVRLSGRARSKNPLTPFFLPRFASPSIFIPAYIEVNFLTCSAIYVRHPLARPGYSEIPSPFDAGGELFSLAWEWYVKRRSRVRSLKQMKRMPEDRAFSLRTAERDIARRKLRKIVARRKLAIRGIMV
ncbi:nam9 protein [Mycena floridula]|nr:nam9 protein [Mycena floridula]